MKTVLQLVDEHGVIYDSVQMDAFHLGSTYQIPLVETRWIQNLFMTRRAYDMVTVLPIVGKKGRGKTWAGLRIGELCDVNGDFGADHVSFTPSKTMELADPLPPGCVILFDEIGVGASHREWQQPINRAFAKFSQTYRKRRGSKLSPDMVMTLPHLGLLDKVARSLVDHAARMTWQGHIRFYNIITDDFEGDYYPVTVGQMRPMRIPFLNRSE